MLSWHTAKARKSFIWIIIVFSLRWRIIFWIKISIFSSSDPSLTQDLILQNILSIYSRCNDILVYWTAIISLSSYINLVAWKLQKNFAFSTIAVHFHTVTIVAFVLWHTEGWFLNLQQLYRKNCTTFLSFSTFFAYLPKGSTQELGTWKMNTHDLIVHIGLDNYKN